ncbi:hypothetical protein BJX76DRAFT_360119 [Aspergillus varians]
MAKDKTIPLAEGTTPEGSTPGAPIYPTITVTTADSGHPSQSSHNPLWICCPSSDEVPEPGTFGFGLTEDYPRGPLSLDRGTVIGEGISLPRVVIVKPIKEHVAKTMIYHKITKSQLIEFSQINGPAPDIGDVAEGFWGFGSPFPAYGMGTVYSVVEDVLVFMVRPVKPVKRKFGDMSVQ